MAEYNFINILSELRKGHSIDDIMSSFTTQVNAALEQQQNDEAFLKKQYEKLASEWNITVQYYVQMKGLPKGVKGQDQLFTDADSMGEMFEGFINLGGAIAQLGDLINEVKSGPTAVPKSGKVNKVGGTTATCSVSWSDIFEDFLKDNGLM